MKRALLYGVLAAALAAVLAAASGLAWLFGTPDGARWLMAAVSRTTRAEIAARQVEGRLFDHLRLAGVSISLPQQKAELDSLDLRWQPLLLLAGIVDVEELTMSGVRLKDATPESTTPPVLSWPRATGLPARLQARVEKLRILRLTYRHLDHEAVDVSSLSASLRWRSRVLSVTTLDVTSPPVRVTGTIEAGFRRPALRLDLAAVSAHPYAGMDRLSLQAELSPARSPEQIAGEVALTAASGTNPRLTVAGDVGVTRSAFNLRKLRITAPGKQGEATGAGSISLAAREPVLSLDLNISALDLASELGTHTDLSGDVAFIGSASRYRGQFTLANRGTGWRSARVSGTCLGNSAGMSLALREGSLLGGTITGDMEASWREELSLTGALCARRLNPAMLAGDWSGIVNFDLSGKMVVPARTPPRGEIAATLLESRLHGKALTGEVRANFSDGDLRIGRLVLRGKGFAINAAGELDRRLAFAADISDLSRLIPATAGALHGNGWIRWREGRLEGSVTGHGRELAADGMRIAAAKLAASTGEGRGYPFHVAATLRKVAFDRLYAELATLEAGGTLPDHSVAVTLRSAGTQARLALAGGYRRGSWQGAIVGLSGSDGVGPWRLAAPAPLSVSKKGVSLSTLVLTGVGEERISLSAGLNRVPAGAKLRAEWRGVNLARVGHWLKEVTVKGSSSGSVRASLPVRGGGAVTGSVITEGEMTLNGRYVPVQRAILNVEADGQGVRAALGLQTPRGGTLRGEFSSSSPPRRLLPEEGTLTASWSGIDLTLARPWLPPEGTLNGRLAGTVEGSLHGGKSLDLRGNVSLAGGTVRWRHGKEMLDAGLRTADVSWSWTGMTLGGRSANGTGSLVVAARVEGTGTYTTDGETIVIERCAARLDGGERGTRGRLDLALADGGAFHGSFSSPSPPGPRIPDAGEIALAWNGLNPQLLNPWLPGTLHVEGGLSGRAEGRLLPGRRVDLQGEATLRGGKIRGQQQGGEVKASLQSARVSWAWKGETLSGVLDLSFAGHGQARGSFRLPLPARFPAAIAPQGTVQGDLTGRLQEKGMLTTFFPGLVEKSHGELDIDLRVGGTWQEPRTEGSFHLAAGGAYLPGAGIHVEDVRLTAHLEKGLVRIDAFRATSGPGRIEGTAVIRLKGWRVAEYRGSVAGERFGTVHLPELQLLVTPRLTFEGTAEKLVVRGEITIPELLILEPQASAAIAPSKDVVIEGAQPPPEKRFPLALDVRVRVIFGDNVRVKAAGIDARLGGDVDLSLASLGKIRSKGEIRVIKGQYRAYGIDLDIVRGRLYYAGGSISQPNLDILALRKVDDVRAGVTVQGVVQAPVIRLYSEPAMTDVDTMAYIVLGHPLGASSEQAKLVAQAAGALLSASQSFLLQDQIKQRLGLSTLEMQTVTGGTSGLMGYKQIPVTPPGSGAPPPGISQSLLTVGKYLTPELYVSYGRSLFTGENLFRLRYDIFKHWQIETQTGSESGADLYYKIEFR